MKNVLAAMQIAVWGSFAVRYAWILWKNKWAAMFPMALLLCAAMIVGYSVMILAVDAPLRWVQALSAVVVLVTGVVLHKVMHDARK